MSALLRILFVALAVGAAGYAFGRIPVEIEAEPIGSVAGRLVTGMDFDARSLDRLDDYLARAASARGCDAVRGPIATIRLYRMQNTTSIGDRPKAVAAATDAARDLRRKLACAPRDGLSWFALFTAQTMIDGRPGGALPFLRMSYFVAPNEGYISQARARLAATLMPYLDPSLQAQVRAEYVVMLRDNPGTALAMLNESSPAVRARLIALFALVPLAERAVLAERIRESGLEIAVPGVKPP